MTTLGVLFSRANIVGCRYSTWNNCNRNSLTEIIVSFSQLFTYDSATLGDARVVKTGVVDIRRSRIHAVTAHFSKRLDLPHTLHRLTSRGHKPVFLLASYALDTPCIPAIC